MERVAPENLRDRHDLPSLQDTPRLIALIKTDDTIKKILTAMGLPTFAPKPSPARPPPAEPSEAGDGGEYLN
jgi:hypothetical protein